MWEFLGLKIDLSDRILLVWFFRNLGKAVTSTTRKRKKRKRRRREKKEEEEGGREKETVGLDCLV